MKQIAVSMRVTEACSYSELRMAISFDWINYFKSLGLLPVMVPICPDIIDQFFDSHNIHAVLLTGGEDIILTNYNNIDSTSNKNNSQIRDYTEYKLIECAIRKKIPLIGICRGFQLLNLYFGGHITHDFPKTKENHIKTIHEVSIIDSKVEELIGSRKMEVNSYHTHVVESKNLSSELIPFALTENNIIEGFYHQNLQIIGLQWHPERESLYKKETTALMMKYLSKGGI